ncbi:MAG: hypothetical protein ACLP53_10250 [Isosphaeraceae bacterium]|jgi:hypothetical protein
MQSLTEGRLTFKFPDGVEAAKLDDWRFYRNQFQKLGATLRVPCGHCGAELRCKQCESAKTLGIKSVDFLVVDTKGSCWLIEVKDYRTTRRTKTVDLADEIARKVRDSLAMLAAASRNASHAEERDLARAALETFEVALFCRPEGAETGKPRATPWGSDPNENPPSPERAKQDS